MSGRRQRPSHFAQPIAAAALAILMGLGEGCTTPSELEADREIGEAYVAPLSMPLYNELSAHPKVVATVKHAEKLTIIGRRRRFLKVRSGDGKAGWTDSRQLLKQEGLDALKDLGARAAKAPAFGSAMVYDPLNVHIDPNRQSPSFTQIQPGERVDVIAYERLPRLPYVFSEIIPPPPKPVPRAKKKKAEPAIPPPEAPDPPPLPPNWMELSHSARLEQEQAAGEPAKPAAPPVPKDDWSLVRMKDGRSGWVLTRLLTMAIPDDVAQYSERQRITAYAALGFVEDQGEKKGIWLWTTLSDTQSPYHYDGVRLFTYSLRRHRYETAFRERDLAGYLPLETKPTANGIGSAFGLLLDTGAGVVRREYQFNGYRVSVAGERPAQPPTHAFLEKPAQPAEGQSPADASLTDRLKGLLK